MAKKGIDVSVWQGNIDWSKVKKAGIDYAIIRCGFGGDSTKYDDSKFKRNADACEKYGIPYGVYLFSYAENKTEALSEAKHVERLVKGRQLAYGVWLDLESKQQSTLSKKKLADVAVTFSEYLEKKGYYVGLYASLYWHNSKLTDSRIKAYDRWIAQWASKCSYKKSYGMWQYSSKGSVSGITGRVDMNYAYKDYPSIMKENGLCNFTKEEEKKEEQVPETPTENIPETPTDEKKETTTTIKKGQKVTLKGVTLYASSTTSTGASKVTGTYYIWDATIMNGRVRITNKQSNAGKSGQVTGWIKKSSI